MGRISPEKEYERVMKILARVRAHVPDLTLTVIGTWDDQGAELLPEPRGACGVA